MGHQVAWFRRRVPGPSTPNAVVAAAQRLPAQRNGSSAPRRIQIPTAGWQAEAWRQYDINGELRFGCAWLGNALSRCRLRATAVDANGVLQLATPVPTEVSDIVEGLLGSPGRQAQVLSALAVHLSVPGDCYVVATIDADGNFTDWAVMSTEEITSAGDGKVRINRGDGYPYTLDLANALVIRIWRPHPRRHFEADSPTRAALPVLIEMEQLSKYIFATLDSRLAGAGILFLPSEMTFPTPRESLEPGEDPFTAVLTEAMVTPISDRGAASAVVPIVVRAPKDALAGVQHMRFDSAMSAEVSDLRDKAIRRLALDLDMPAEVLLGAGDSSHWNAWQIEEQAIKLHIEPVMVLICAALTEGYLRPALAAAGIDDDEWALWFDSSDLVLRPNRNQDAKDVWDRGALSDDTLRRENGFVDSDAPAGQEACRNAVMAFIKAAPNSGDQFAKILLPLLGLDSCGISPDDLVAPQPVATGTNPSVPNADPASTDRPIPSPGNSTEPGVNPNATPNG